MKRVKDTCRLFKIEIFKLFFKELNTNALNTPNCKILEKYLYALFENFRPNSSVRKRKIQIKGKFQ